MRAPNDATIVPPVARLKRRADFLRAGQGKRWHGKTLSLQVSSRPDEADLSSFPRLSRVGFTLTRKVGNAVVRNRARRRLKEALRLSPGLSLKAGHDYVLIGRIDAIRLPFAALQDEIARAVAAVHQVGRDRSGRGRAQRRCAEGTRQTP